MKFPALLTTPPADQTQTLVRAGVMTPIEYRCPPAPKLLRLPTKAARVLVRRTAAGWIHRGDPESCTQNCPGDESDDAHRRLTKRADQRQRFVALRVLVIGQYQMRGRAIGILNIR